MPIDEVLKRLPQLKKFRAGVPATDVDVASVESTLAVRLPADYVAFLRTFGFVRWFGHCVYGIVRPEVVQVPGYDYSMVTHTVHARAEAARTGLETLPLEGVVIERYDAGGWYVLFTEGSGRSGTVALFDHEAGGAEVQGWPSLEAFLAFLGV